VIYRDAGDDWGAQYVEALHVRIVDMHPVNRAERIVVMGELRNVLDSEDAFEISQTLLPK
jgi:flagellin-specific chaperone FliS